MVMTILNKAEAADFVYLQRETQLTSGNLASHLAKLEENSYVVVEKGFQGRVPLTLYQLTQEGRNAFQSYKKHLREIIESQ